MDGCVCARVCVRACVLLGLLFSRVFFFHTGELGSGDACDCARVCARARSGPRIARSLAAMKAEDLYRFSLSRDTMKPQHHTELRGAVWP